MKRLMANVAVCACVSLVAVFAAVPGRADETPAARAARWHDIENTLFKGKTAMPDASVIKLDAPKRAQDASLVPITITLNRAMPVKGLYLVIDENPSPVVAHYTFGPAADPHVIEMRVRVNTYTNMHAVAELKDGRLVEAVKFVKAAGGCSAPMGMSPQEAKKHLGEMRMRFAKGVEAGKPTQATLMIRHPMFNGMQMDQLTHYYIPARYIQNIKVRDGDKLVFSLATGISLASNPVIRFGFIPQPSGALTVAVNDSRKGHWTKSFTVPMLTN